MKKVKKVFFVLFTVMMVFVLVFSGCGGKQEVAPILIPEKYSPPHSKPGPAVDKLVFGSFHVDQAVTEMLAGKMDLYVYGLKITAAKELQGKQDLKSYQSPASSISILLNPAPDSRGLNPFSLPEVRKAMNYLIDRGFITQDIYGGLAKSQVSLVSPLDYDYLTVHRTVKERNIAYDFEYAKATIGKAMRQAGAELTDGKWHYQGELIRLKFIIRTEDERREVGDTVRVALEKAGFQVEAAYKTFAAAIFTVYSSDSQTFEWHLYTEGWGRGGAEKYDFASVNQFSAPWMGNMPGWQIIGFWNYQNLELDRLGKQLFTGSFTGKGERDQIYREMVKLSLEDSIRVWIATIYNTFPAQNALKGVTEDLVAGPKSLLTLREAYIPGKDTLRIGNLWVYTERSVWNPIGGFEDVYSIDIWKNLYDPPITNHPFSGLPMAFRVGFEVETAGPTGKLEVPREAVMWNAEKDIWEQIPAGAKATSKVVFDYSKYFQSNWHHYYKEIVDEVPEGVPESDVVAITDKDGRVTKYEVTRRIGITMADVIYSIYSTFERTYDSKKKQIEFVASAVQKPFLDTFRGIKVLDENRLEVYLDFWHFEEDYIASYASLSSLPLPWEILAAMDELVFEKKMAAYSKTTAAKDNVPWLSLVMSNHSALVAKALREFQNEGFLPENVFTLGGKNWTSLDETQARYQASLSWYDEYQHMIISQGPFYLSRYDPPAQYAELLAFRDPTYPFKPGDWYFGSVESLDFAKVEESQGAVTAEVRGPGQISLDYVVFNPVTGQIEKAGQARKVGEGHFEVSLDGVSGKFLQVSLLAYSDELAVVKEKEIQIKR